MVKPLSLKLSSNVEQHLSKLSRTEDIKFSPCGSKIAIAEYYNNKISIIYFEEIQDNNTNQKIIYLKNYVRINSNSLENPHGIDFIDDKTIVVANRSKEGAVLKLPPRDYDGHEFEAPLINSICTKKDIIAIQEPSCIAVSQLSENLFEVITCHNGANTDVKSILDKKNNYNLIFKKIFIQEKLDIPDGVAIDKSRKYLAISNHGTHSVFIYDLDLVEQNPEPVGILYGVKYPHGLFFSNNLLIVADAGSQYMYVYRANNSGWKGIFYPINSIKAVDEFTFKKGNYNPQEGGVKGADINSNNIMVTTCEHQPIAFFNLSYLDKFKTKNIEDVSKNIFINFTEKELVKSFYENNRLQIENKYLNSQLESFEKNLAILNTNLIYNSNQVILQYKNKFLTFPGPISFLGYFYRKITNLFKNIKFFARRKATN